MSEDVPRWSRMETQRPQQEVAWLLVCSAPDDAMAHVGTRSPGHQTLHERSVKREERKENTHTHINPLSFPSLVFFNRIFLGAVRTCISLPSLAKAERQR